MAKVLMIGAGGVATVAAFKIAQNADVFTDFMIASRRKAKCDKIVEEIHKAGYKMDIKTAQVDADDVEQLKALFNSYQPELVINLALPYQDLTIMDACLACGCNYLDTANYEPKDEAHFEYSWQWAYKDRFEQAGLTAILGCGFDPGVSGVYTAYAAKHYFDEIHYLDIVDCNAGDHHHAFATNFNPEINIREITQKGLYYKDGQWIETEPLEIHKPLTYPNIGPRESYLLHHEELESLVKNYPTIKQGRFWMTFGEQYLKHLDVIQNIGMSRIDEIEYEAPLADGSGEEAKFSRDFLRVDVDVDGVPGADLSLYTTHSKSRRPAAPGQVSADTRRLSEGRAMRDIAEKEMKEFPGRLFVLTGDFNDNTDDASVQAVLNPGGGREEWVDSLAGKPDSERNTWPANPNRSNGFAPEQFDHMIFPKSMSDRLVESLSEYDHQNADHRFKKQDQDGRDQGFEFVHDFSFHIALGFVMYS